ncbi:nitroreductase family protein [Anaerococcus sp. AGMB00486]|uniref:Nitroreductase family protein n=2 Tax=Anaerococcus TaxID=165779 RepID=A0ABX2N9U9_9FIRM|nr:MULTISPECIES: nitroreductase family protein [Anaerococcus]MSS78311.1 nitroreductase family protein [Anaerococcus porci]NVF11425.1 nitroreductase family protein [Anaerococcus faecalis]
MDFDKVIDKRCSTRLFTDEIIDRKDLEAIVNAGTKAPVGKGLYANMAITVITNKEYIGEILEEAREVANNYKANPIYSAPYLIIVSAKKGHETRLEDTACIIENMSLKATDLDIGSCYIRGMFEKFDKKARFIEKLGVKEDFYPVHGLILGKTNEEIKGKKHHIDVNYID